MKLPNLQDHVLGSYTAIRIGVALIALDIGGISLIGVGLVPMEWECTEGCGGLSWHGFLAITFFVAIAYVCLRRASDTVGLIEEQGRKGSIEKAVRYRRTYKLFGLWLILPRWPPGRSPPRWIRLHRPGA